MPGDDHAQTIAAPNQDTTHITAAQGFSNEGFANPGPSVVTSNRMPITNASRIQAAAVVQCMVQRIQNNRVPPNLLGDLSQEQKQSVKDQMNQMMPMFMKLDQLMPFFFVLTGNRDATARLILIKFMFQDQLDSLRHEQYTITPENLVRLKDRLQHYFMWVESELAPANYPVPIVQIPGSATNVAQPIAPGTAPAPPTNTGLTGLIVSMAGVTLGTGPGSTSTAAFTNAPSEPASN
ncbi:MAG: mediator complex subunit 15-domain-containing protein [Linnemannia gamsii]|nr:MAG: mediator complex subunit 15-domain-containing protein [Linnemannia gamsii]